MRPGTRFVAGPNPSAEPSHVKPLDLSTTYRTPDFTEAVKSIEALAQGEAEASNPVYARLYNANVRDFEERMTALEGGVDSVAFASGMAAISGLLMAARSRGGHIVAIPPLYGGTHHLLESGILDVEVTWSRPEDAATAVRPDTALVLLETPANPTLRLRDIQTLAHAVHPAPLAVDSTFATPALQQPLGLGAGFSLHSATKFIGGHGDALGGVVSTTDAGSAALLRQVRIATGGVLHPLAAHLLTRGLKTLPIRMAAAQASAQELVRRLEGHREVVDIGYPGRGEGAHLLHTQMSGPGAVLSLRLKGGPARADAFAGALEVVTPAVSLGSVDTLIQRPAALTHRTMGEAARGSAGIPEDLLRISVGLEDVEDLWDDLATALASTAAEPVQGRGGDPLLRRGQGNLAGAGQG